MHVVARNESHSIHISSKGQLHHPRWANWSLRKPAHCPAMLSDRLRGRTQCRPRALPQRSKCFWPIAITAPNGQRSPDSRPAGSCLDIKGRWTLHVRQYPPTAGREIRAPKSAPTKLWYLCLGPLGHVRNTSERHLSPAQRISHLQAHSTENPTIPSGQAKSHSGINRKIIGGRIYKGGGVSEMVGKRSSGPQDWRKMVGVRRLHQSQWRVPQRQFSTTANRPDSRCNLRAWNVILFGCFLRVSPNSHGSGKRRKNLLHNSSQTLLL